MNHFFKFLSLVSFLILFSGCYTYQMSSWNDDDGIYVSSIRNYNYGQYFSDLANEIIEEYEDSGIVDSEDPDNLPWGYKPDQTQIFIDFYPRYSGYGYPYGYGSLYGYGYYPYNYYWGRNFYNPYYPYGYYGYGYGYPESHQYWPYINRLRLYPYYYYDRYNYNGYAYNNGYFYNKDKDPVNTSGLGYSNSSSRRGEKTTSASGKSSESSSNIRNYSTLSVSSRSGGYNISSNEVPNLRSIKDNYRMLQAIERNIGSNSRYINSSRYNNSRDYTGSTIGKFNSNSRPTNGVYGKSSNSRSSSGSSNVGSRSSGSSSGGGSKGGSSSGGGSRGGGID